MEKMMLNGAWKVDYADRMGCEVQIPCAVERVMEKRDFSGPFRFYRTFCLEEKKKDEAYVLDFAGVSYDCQVFLNGKRAGEHEGIWDGFQFDVTGVVKEGENLLEVIVQKPDFDKESPYFFRSVLFGFIPDIMLPFGGIWKEVSLRSHPKAYWKEADIRFDAKTGAITITSCLAAEQEKGCQIYICVKGPDGKKKEYREEFRECVSIEPEVFWTWSPDEPNLYSVDVKLYSGEILCDERRFRGGFRNIRIEGEHILINGESFYMRGALHWGAYPDRMVPVPTYEEIKEELLKLKEMGFNTVKHCLYFPPEDYYALCDELGIVTWQELPLWLPYPNEWLKERIYTQYPKMLRLFSCHPTVSVVSLGCELDATVTSEVLKDLYQMVKDRDDQMIICDNSGSGECFAGVTEADSDIYDYHFYAQLYEADTLMHEFTAGCRKKKPWLFGEYNDADTYRLSYQQGNPWWTDKDEGRNLLRKVHKGFGSDLPVYDQQEIERDYGVEEEVKELPLLSMKQMLEIRKYLLELTRSFPEIKGYNITSIRDVPITTSGLFDDAGNRKGETWAYQQMNGEVVLSLCKNLTRIWDGGGDHFLNRDLFVYFHGESIKGRLVLSNQSSHPVMGTLAISLLKEGECIYRKEISCGVPKSGVLQIAQLEIPLPEQKEAAKYSLKAQVSCPEGTYENEWQIWAYQKPDPMQRLCILDDSGSFLGIGDYFSVRRLKGSKDVKEMHKSEILLTTRTDFELFEEIPKGVSVILAVKGRGALKAEAVPFYRENISRIFAHPVTDMLLHNGYCGIQFFGCGNNLAFDKKELEDTLGTYKSLIRRYDARNFKVSEYLIEYVYAGHKVMATTLNLDGTKGSQPYCFGENHLGITLLSNMLSCLENRKTGGEHEVSDLSAGGK